MNQGCNNKIQLKAEAMMATNLKLNVLLTHRSTSIIFLCEFFHFQSLSPLCRPQHQSEELLEVTSLNVLIELN